MKTILCFCLLTLQLIAFALEDSEGGIATLEVSGTAQGGSLTIGLAGTTVPTVTINTSAGASAIDLAAALNAEINRLEPPGTQNSAQWYNTSGVDGNKITFRMTVPGTIYLKTTDAGILALAKVTGLAATKVGRGVRLTWNAVPNADKYLIFRDGSPAVSSATNSLDDDFDNEWDQIALEVGERKTLTYFVVARKGANLGSPPSDVIEIGNPLKDAASLKITSLSTVLEGQRNAVYNFQFATEGGTAPITWSISGGDLPDGLVLSATGALSGTPTESGKKTFSLKVTDSAGAMFIKSHSIVVKE